MAGVKRVRASYQKQQVEVEYDEAKLTPAAIAGAIRQLGYTLAG